MLPLFPSNQDPTIILSGSLSQSANEENEISELEQEHTKFFQELEHIANDLTPIGKLNSNEQNNDSDNETNSDDSNDDDSNEEEDDSNDDQAEVTMNY